MDLVPHKSSIITNVGPPPRPRDVPTFTPLCRYWFLGRTPSVRTSISIYSFLCVFVLSLWSVFWFPPDATPDYHHYPDEIYSLVLSWETSLL